METCDYCGGYKKVRKEYTTNGLHLGYTILYSWYSGNYYWYSYICEECDKAQKIIIKRDRETAERLKKKRQLEWIKKRDKILMENNIK